MAGTILRFGTAVSALFVAAALSFPGPVLAQDASSVTEPAPGAAEGSGTAAADTPSEPAPAAEAGDAPATAADAEAPNAPPEPQISTQTYGDWEVRCLEVEPRTCFMFYLAVDEQKTPTAEIRIEKLPEGREALAGVIVVTPNGTWLQNGVILKIDNSDPTAFPYSYCTNSSCVSRFGLNTASLAAFKRGNKALFVVASVNAPDKPIPLEVSLSGFTAAFDALPVTP